MAFSKERICEPPSVSEITENEASSERQDEILESRPKIVEDYRAWLYVLAGFVTYIDVS